MKITDVITTILNVRLPEPIIDATYVIPNRSAVLVEIRTSEGISGWGEACFYGGPPEVTKQIIDTELRSYLIGQDPRDIERLWENMYRGTVKHGRKGALIACISGIDIALWDIRGKVLNLPVYKLLGGLRESIPAYASGGFYSQSKDVEGLVEEVKSYVEKGFRAIKIKVGRESLTHDIQRVEAVRKAIGDDIVLMVDGNNAYMPYEAVTMGRALEELGAYWFEEPVPAEDVEGCAQVAHALDVAVAAGENEFTRYGYRDLILARAADILQPDVTWCGGITEARNIAYMASAWNIPCVPHAFSSAICLVANLHLNCGIPNSLFQEFDQNYNPLRSELTNENIKIDKESHLAPPQGPGLGVTINRDCFNKYRVEE